MEDKINELRETFVEEITEDVALPAAQHLLTMNKNAEKPLKGKDEIFYLVTAKFLYIMKRVRSDLEPTVDFFFTRATKDDGYDCKNLQDFGLGEK